MQGEREGMWPYSENKCYLLASRQSLQSGTWKDWMSISQCAADLSCLSALHDEAQSLNALLGFMCLWMSYAVALSCFYCCSCAVFISWLFINGCTISQAGVFYHYWCTVYGRYALGGWIFQAETTHSTIYTQSVPGWASLSFEIFFCVHGILSFLFCDSSHSVEWQGTLWDRDRRVRRGGHVVRYWAGDKPRMSCLHPLRHQDALWVKKLNLDSSLEIWPRTVSNVVKVWHLTLKEAPHA